ncbi:hypothetical protein EWM64_g2753 [Hericium alpestre]|uniref:Uncharacterized protein n=1 Tax=Hericium alpestre TaxID=135208 RepID=A0A4Z0A4L5_9AGAM|nr:hypothetical protein EWM64_g2753 [Hericium alpestre]
MPPYRRKMRCAGYDAEPKPKAAPKAKTPRAAPRTKLSDEEKAQKREEAAKKKALTEKKKEWKATLKPWNVDTTFKLGVGGMAMYKSDAKHAYGLTEEEILTLPHESIACSPKTFYACQTAADLSLKKEKFFDPDFIIPPPDETQQVWRGLLKKPRAVFKKTDDDPARRKNFDARDVTTQVFSETKDPRTLLLLDFM